MRAASTFKRSVVAGSLAAQAVAVGSSQEQEGFVSCSSTCSRVQTYKVFLVQVRSTGVLAGGPEPARLPFLSFPRAAAGTERAL